MSFLNEILPFTSEAFGLMRNSIFKDSYLDVKTKELILLPLQFLCAASSVSIHVPKGQLQQGSPKEEIAEAISVAMFIAAGSQIGWTNVYIENIYDKIFKKIAEKNPIKKNKNDCNLYELKASIHFHFSSFTYLCISFSAMCLTLYSLLFDL